MSRLCLVCDEEMLFRTEDGQEGQDISFQNSGLDDRHGGAFHTTCAERAGEVSTCSNVGVCEVDGSTEMRSSKDIPIEGWACQVESKLPLVKGKDGRQEPSIIRPYCGSAVDDDLMYKYPVPGDTTYSNKNETWSAKQSKEWIDFAHDNHHASDDPAKTSENWTAKKQAWNDLQELSS